MAPPTSLIFKVTRQEPDLVAPAKPTPHESKQLSDIDDQGGLRFQEHIIQFYQNNPLMRGRDPVKVIREALAQTLVYYYPFAGRLREGPGGKLIVECTGEGVIFIEADADVTLEQFGDALKPPFPCLEELLYEVPASGGFLDCPLLLIQVTRLKCGGFTFALQFNHTMSDGTGILQFMTAMAEMARGELTPSIQPVWLRELLSARDPPCVTCAHHEFDEIQPTTKATLVSSKDMRCHTFFFGPTEVSTLRRFLPPHLRSCSTFEVLSAYLWRCRTLALQFDPSEKVRLMCVVNARTKLNPPLPTGYYGNVVAMPAALTTAGKLLENQLGYALELVMKAKNSVTNEYMKSLADLLALKGRPECSRMVQTYYLSNVTRLRFREVDFGWGKAAYGGPAKAGGPKGEDVPNVSSFFIAFTNSRGENGIVVPICLPALAMERFVKELDSLLEDHPTMFIKSPL